MENARIDGPAAHLFTVGHSVLEPEAFIALLQGAGVTAVADVRSSPYSRRRLHFNRRPLEALLGHHGIAYVFLGRELGGRPADPALYHPEGHADYERIRQTAAFAAGIDRVLDGLQSYAIALMCSEEDPLDCHRGLMIAPALTLRGVSPDHIRKGGVLETMARFEQRLQDETGTDGRSQLEEAYRVMNARKAYRLALGEEKES